MNRPRNKSPWRKKRARRGCQRHVGRPRAGHRRHGGLLAAVARGTSVAVWLLVLGQAARADEPVAAAADQAEMLDSTHGLIADQHALKFLGPRSCAATACHGGVEFDPRFPLSRRNEYVSWLDNDPHARAHLTLSHEKSRLILARLTRADDAPPVQARRLANCLGCHNPQPPQARQADTFYARDGVSCEICHGAAEKWVGAHVEADWRDEKTRDPAAWRIRAGELGFVDTEDLVVRGTTCAQCHVGSPGREVNHDLVAAGHPVLKFELTAYHELLPKHWRADAERRADAGFEAKLWSAGQITAADAALSLLGWRADPAADKHPDAAWPELAEYDCFACHHDLEDPSWRRQRTVSGLPLGMPAWGTWYFGPLRQMNATADEPGQSLAALTGRLQQAFGRDRQNVRSAAGTARTQLELWRQAESLAGVGERMRRALRGLVVAHGQPDKTDAASPANWDEAVQLYLAIVALDDDARKIDPAALGAMRELLSFPAHYDSPRGFFEQRLPGALPGDAAPATPYQRSRKQVIAAMMELIQQLEPPGN